MKNKFLPYILSFLIAGGSSAVYAGSGLPALGRDKTPDVKPIAQTVKKSSSSVSQEGKVPENELTFFYSGKTNPADADNTVRNSICPKAGQVLGKSIDCERFANWIKTREGPQDITDTLVIDKDKSRLYFKGTDNCFNVTENYKIAATSPTIENKSKSGWIKGVRVGIATLEDCTGLNAGVEFNKWGISYTRATKDYAPVSNPGSSTGNRFIYDWNSTIKRDDIKENISLDVNLLQSKNKGATLFSGAVYSRFTKGINKQTMEQILDKKTGTVLSKDSNSLNQTKIEEAKQLELGLDLTVKKGFLNGFGIRAVEYFGEGGSTTFGGYLNYTYTLSK